MFKKLIIFMALISFAISAYSMQDSIFVDKWQSLGKKITLLLGAIDNEFKAKQAIPQLQKLTKKFKSMTAEFARLQKAKSLFDSRYAPEAIKTLKNLKKALKNFSANDDIPLELREKIIKMLKKFNK